MPIAIYEKHRIALYHWLLGRSYFRAARAMTYAEKFHNGLRKDGITPEFAHQVWIANFQRTLPIPEHMLEDLIASVFLHDTPEDYDVGFDEIANRFGASVADPVERLTKKHRGVAVPEETYFARQAENAVSALAKGGDRLHNIGSMVGVFTREKQVRYIEETRTWHIPMLKQARRNFPELAPAFENIKMTLVSRIELIEAIHAAEGDASA